MDKDNTDKWIELEKRLSKLEESELYGKKGFEPVDPPLHKNVKIETGKPGAEEAADKFDASKDMGTKTDNKNDSGACCAPEKFEGNNDSAGKTDGNDAKEGAAGGAEIAKKGYASASFRSKLSSTFGLSLDDKLNKPNMGKDGLK